MTAVPVTVVIDGRTVPASREAMLERGTVVGALDPFVYRIARQITVEADGRITVRLGAHGVDLVPGSRVALVDGVPTLLDIAPRSQGGSTTVPLGPVARALGARVDYDGVSRTLAIFLPGAAPLATMTPAPEPLPPVEATPSPAVFRSPMPRASSAAPPQPRRTPIVIAPP